MRTRQIVICISIVLPVILLLILLFSVLSSSKDINITYIPNFLSEEDFKIIKQNLQDDKRSFKNESFRKIKPLDTKNQVITDIFYSPKNITALNKQCKARLFKTEFPIEHRIYPNGSKGMHWHIDTLMYDLPQYEAVFTINNNSDSVTEWLDNNIKRQWTEPNSLLLVKAQGHYHHVTPVTNGSREILKLIYTQCHTPNDNYYKELERFN